MIIRFTLLFMFAFSINTFGQNVSVIKLSGLNQILSHQNDTTYVLNFWATWCKPCVKELPYFDSLYLSFQNQKVSIILISLDNVKDMVRKIIPFVQQRKVKPEVLLLDETDYNKWIDMVEPSWGGAIPVTLIYNRQNEFRKFLEGETDFKELSKYVNASLKHSTSRK